MNLILMPENVSWWSSLTVTSSAGVSESFMGSLLMKFSFVVVLFMKTGNWPKKWGNRPNKRGNQSKNWDF